MATTSSFQKYPDYYNSIEDCNMLRIIIKNLQILDIKILDRYILRQEMKNNFKNIFVIKMEMKYLLKLLMIIYFTIKSYL